MPPLVGASGPLRGSCLAPLLWRRPQAWALGAGPRGVGTTLRFHFLQVAVGQALRWNLNKRCLTQLKRWEPALLCSRKETEF